MTILFIGGTGNISTDCATVLQQRGHRITMLTRGRTPVPAAYEALPADRTDAASLQRALAGRSFDAVIDFVGYDVPETALTVEALRGRTRQFIFISTTVVYRKPPEVLPVTETAPLGNRFSAYGRKKQACEGFLMEQQQRHDFAVTIVRPSHTYSCRWLPNPVSSVGFTVAARLLEGRPVFVHDDGQGLWTLTATTDFAVGLAGLVGNPAAIGQAYQITSDQVLTWNQIMDETCAALGVRHPAIVHIPTDFICQVEPIMEDKLRGDKAHHGVFDCRKVKRIVPDFECRTTFRDGVRAAVAWFRADPARQTRNPDVDAIFDRVIVEWERQ